MLNSCRTGDVSEGLLAPKPPPPMVPLLVECRSPAHGNHSALKLRRSIRGFDIDGARNDQLPHVLPQGTVRPVGAVTPVRQTNAFMIVSKEPRLHSNLGPFKPCQPRQQSQNLSSTSDSASFLRRLQNECVAGQRRAQSGASEQSFPGTRTLDAWSGCQPVQGVFSGQTLNTQTCLPQMWVQACVYPRFDAARVLLSQVAAPARRGR